MMDKANFKNKGMTLPELILAIFMLGAFTAVFVVVTQFTSKFFQKNLRVDKGNNTYQENDILNMQYNLYKNFDFLKEFLSQPGYDNLFFSDLNSKPLCSDDPERDWNIPPNYEINVPSESRICIRELLPEGPKTDFVKESFKPGIYILYSAPKTDNEELTFNTIPIRTIFCRPRPFCSSS